MSKYIPEFSLFIYIKNVIYYKYNFIYKMLEDSIFDGKNLLWDLKLTNYLFWFSLLHLIWNQNLSNDLKFIYKMSAREDSLFKLKYLQRFCLF